MRVPVVISSSVVIKTPKGIFWIGKSLFAGTSIHDLRWGLLAVGIVKAYWLQGNVRVKRAKGKRKMYVLRG
jgi:hypothetical protein